MKIFCASLVHESNSFSPIPTGIDSYREAFLYRPSTGEGADTIETISPEGNLRLRVRAAGHELIDGLHAAATPSGPTIQQDYETLREELLSNLRDAMPVDAVLLFLHGAQVAYGYDDCEGDVLKRVREIVGAEVPVGVELDLHANLTQRMVDNVTIIMCCKEYPHTDFGDRAGELLDLIERTYRGEIRPVMVRRRVPLLGIFHTTRQPMRGFVDRLFQMEEHHDILSISIAHGFGYADTAETGASVLVVVDNNDSAAEILADELAAELFSMRELIKAPVMSVAAALDEALAAPSNPVVIADTSDNPGGGAAGDSTFILRALLERNVQNAALAMLWDPGAVRVAERAGEGARLSLRIGGKTGSASGAPLDVEATVLRLRTDATQKAFGSTTPIGPAAALQIEGVTVIVSSIREQVHDIACFTEFGVDVASMKLLVVKSAQHFHASFAPIAPMILYAAPPGTVTSDFSSLPYEKIKRPIWPIDQTPFEVFGRIWND